MPEKSILKKIQVSFPHHGKADWLASAAAEVNGKNPFEILQWHDKELSFSPYNDKSDFPSNTNSARFLFPSTNSFLGPRTWHSLSPVTVGDEKKANVSSHNHVMNGADGLLFDVQKKNIQLSTLLSDLQWPFCQLSFVSPQESTLVSDILEHCRGNNYTPAQIEGTIFWKKKVAATGADVRAYADFNKFRVSGMFVEASSPVQEIADALIHGVRVINNLLAEGIPSELAINNIAFSFPTGTHFLPEIGKLRAMRQLWYQVTQAYGHSTFDPSHLHIHARSEAWTNDAFQPHGNMLKGTTASIAAVCGGCNALTVYGEEPENPLMQRIARNTSVILREESHFNKVQDPLAGSYSLEAITRQLAQEAWNKFQSATTN